MHLFSSGEEHDNQPDKRLFDSRATPSNPAYEAGAECDDIGLKETDASACWSEKMDDSGYSLGNVLRARVKIRCGVRTKNRYDIVGFIALNSPFPKGIRAKQTYRKQQYVGIWREPFI